MQGVILLYVHHQSSTYLPPVKNSHRTWEEGYWMSDKPPVQQALATELAEIILKIPDPTSSLLFLKGFWHTVVREWNGIDRLRYSMVYPKLISTIMTPSAGWTNTTCWFGVSSTPPSPFL